MSRKTFLPPRPGEVEQAPDLGDAQSLKLNPQHDDRQPPRKRGFTQGDASTVGAVRQAMLRTAFSANSTSSGVLRIEGVSRISGRA